MKSSQTYSSALPCGNRRRYKSKAYIYFNRSRIFASDNEVPAACSLMTVVSVVIGKRQSHEIRGQQKERTERLPEKLQATIWSHIRLSSLSLRLLASDWLVYDTQWPKRISTTQLHSSHVMSCREMPFDCKILGNYHQRACLTYESLNGSRATTILRYLVSFLSQAYQTVKQCIPKTCILGMAFLRAYTSTFVG